MRSMTGLSSPRGERLIDRQPQKINIRVSHHRNRLKGRA
jgi:hypothetical protein